MENQIESESEGQPLQIAMREFWERLEQYSGVVSISWSFYGLPRKTVSHILEINRTINIEVMDGETERSIPFIGCGVAIKEIIGFHDGLELYTNPLIHRRYDIRDPERVARLRNTSYGV